MMKYISNYKNVKQSDALDNAIKSNCEKLDKYFNKDYTCYANVSTKGKGSETNCVEITIKTDRFTYRAESTTSDFYKSVNEDIEKIKRQINKRKNKMIAKKRKVEDKNMEAIHTDNDFHAEEPSFSDEIIRRKRFELTPMSYEEAILQLDMLDHDFFMFINDSTGETNLVYKRKDGGVGIIEAIDYHEE